MLVIDVTDLSDVNLSSGPFQQAHTQSLLKVGDSTADIKFFLATELRLRLR